MADFLRLLASELENNKSMAKRLSAPLLAFLESETLAAPKQPRGKTKIESSLPEGFDPFHIYYEQGKLGLLASLQGLDINTLKAVLSEYGLDPARTYARWRKRERLTDLIVERVKALSNKGKVFESR
jgi:hypothetical protein